MSKSIFTAALALSLTAFSLNVAQAADLKLPMLPGAAVAQAVVNVALSSSSEMVSQAASIAPSTPATSKAVARKVTPSLSEPVAVVQTRSAATGRSLNVFATAYNSEGSQTDATPFITATGTRTRPGVLAVSRDLLRVFPYGSRVRLEDTSGRNSWVSGRTFVVEDTMNARFTNRIDLWMPSHSQALQWGGRSVRITALH